MKKSIVEILARQFGAALVFLGCLLILVNLVGAFFYTTINNNHPNLLDKHPRTISEIEFWNQAYQYENETQVNYLGRFTKLVSDRMLLIEKKYTKPTLFENWILWGIAQVQGDYEWINTKKAVRLGGGYCSQHAIVFDNILKEQGMVSRILALNGHVLNEVLVGGKWRVYDPDFNVVYSHSLKWLEDNPDEVFSAYKTAGLTDNEAKLWAKVFSSEVDNWHIGSSISYSTDAYIIEKLSFYLIWVLPGIMIFTGLLIRRLISN